MLLLPNPFTIQINSIQTSSLLDVNAIDAHEGIDDGLTAIGNYGVAETVADDLDRHARLDADAIARRPLLGGNAE